MKYTDRIDLSDPYLSWQSRIREDFDQFDLAKDIIQQRRGLERVEDQMRELIDKYFEGNGIRISSRLNEICFRPNSSLTLYLNALKALDPNKNIVIIAAPYFDPLYDIIKENKRRPVILETAEDGYKVNPEKLRKMIKDCGGDRCVATVVINNPCNPLMLEYTESELQAIAQVIQDTGVRLIVDELYSNLGTKRHKSIAGVELADGSNIHQQTFTMDSTSKKFGDPHEGKMAFACCGDLEWMRDIQFLQSQQFQYEPQEKIERSLLFIETVQHNDLPERQEYMQRARAGYIRNIGQANLAAGTELFKIPAPITTGYYTTLGIAPDILKIALADATSPELRRVLSKDLGIATTTVDGMRVHGAFVRANISHMQDTSLALKRISEYGMELLQLKDARERAAELDLI